MLCTKHYGYIAPRSLLKAFALKKGSMPRLQSVSRFSWLLPWQCDLWDRLASLVAASHRGGASLPDDHLWQTNGDAHSDRSFFMARFTQPLGKKMSRFEKVEKESAWACLMPRRTALTSLSSTLSYLKIFVGMPCSADAMFSGRPANTSGRALSRNPSFSSLPYNSHLFKSWQFELYKFKRSNIWFVTNLKAPSRLSGSFLTAGYTTSSSFTDMSALRSVSAVADLKRLRTTKKRPFCSSHSEYGPKTFFNTST